MKDRNKIEIISFSVAIILHLIALMVYAGTSSATIPLEYKKIKIRLGNSQEDEAESALNEVEVRKYIGYEEETPEIHAPEEFTNDGVNTTQTSNETQMQIEHSAASQKISGAKYGNFVNEGQTQANDYLELLQYTIQQRSSIPRTEGLRLKGQAVLRLSFNRKGQILEYKLIKKTGNFVLDQAAVEVADSLRQNPFPPAPANFDKGQKILRYDFFVNYDSEKAEW